MSVSPTARDRALLPFIDGGFSFSVEGDFLLIHDVPYLGEGPTLLRGTLIAPFIEKNGEIAPPPNHQLWFRGDFPRRPTNALLEAIGHPQSTVTEAGPGVPANYYFSCKPENFVRFETQFDQILHYEKVLTAQAKALDPDATARTKKPANMKSIPTPFQYPDAASIRGAYAGTSQRLALGKVAIIGLGGTGSYVLDQVAKTPVWEIHLFDGDDFDLHNAFRAPGAAEEARFGSQKVAYYAAMYAPMHKGIVPHDCYVDRGNVAEVAGFDFVFICVDKGPARKLISEFLRQNAIPFVDCGMDLKIDRGRSEAIYGQCRATLCTPPQHAHFDSCAPYMEDAGDGLYDQNIQVADMNALNAIMAVIRWKQYFSFYADQMGAHQQVFSVSTQSLSRSFANKSSKNEANNN